MKRLVTQIRETARRLLSEGRVELVLGFEPGPIPLRNAPAFVRSPDEAGRLTWDRSCAVNLAVFLQGNPRRTAIFAKGCDSRAIVNLVKERQVVRENLVIVGVPCRGMIDRAKVERLLAGAEIESAAFVADKIDVTAGGKTFETAVESVLRDACRECPMPTPLHYDLLLDGAEGRAPASESRAFREAQEKLDRAERWRRFQAEAARCIRCYACRNVCPLCYCGECLVDQGQPRWIGTAPDAGDNQLYWLMRALHLAGRCVDCGACVDACPTGVDVRHLFKRMEREVRERFGYVAGRDSDETPPLATFDTDDPEDYVTDV